MASDARAGASGSSGPAPARKPPAIRVASLVDGKPRASTGEAPIVARGQRAPADPSARNATVWVDLTDPDKAFVGRISALLGLHPLIAEDIVEGNQRGKIEVTDGLIHVVLFVLFGHPEHTTEEVDLVL